MTVRDSRATKRTVTIDDMFEITDCIAFAADEELDTIALITSKPDVAANKAVRRLWRGNFSAGVTLANEGAGAHFVAVSGDGSATAWCKDIGRETFLTVSRDGDSTVRTLKLPARCRGLALTPDGRKVALLLDVKTEEGWTGTHYRYRSIRIKSDAEGYWDGSRAALFVKDLNGSDERANYTQVEHGMAGDCSWPTWSCDGRKLAFVTSEPGSDRHMNHMSIWVHDTQTDKTTEWLKAPGPVQGLTWSPEGDALAFAGNGDSHGGFHVPWDIFAVSADGHARNLTNGQQGVGDRILGDVSASTGWAAGPIWTNTGVLFLGDNRGSAQVFLAASGSQVSPLTRVGQHVRMFAAGQSSGRLVTLVTTATSLPRIERSSYLAGHAGVSTLPGGEWNRDLERNVEIREPLRTLFHADDGAAIDAWVLEGVGAGPRPTIVQIHGGPHASYGETYFHEFQWLAANGFTIFYCNPRGSLGYAPEFTGGIVGAWGKQDAADVMAGVKWLKEQPDVDPNRIGVTGGSYGGYLTNWLIAHHDDFRAAVTDRSLTNASSFYGTSEIGPFFSTVAFGGTPWERPDEYKRASPITYAPQMTTPLLVLHATNDAQTPVEQGEQLYVALRSLGRTAELAVFPGANHELSRAGAPAQRKARLEMIKEWFDRYMGE